VPDREEFTVGWKVPDASMATGGTGRPAVTAPEARALRLGLPRLASPLAAAVVCAVATVVPGMAQDAELEPLLSLLAMSRDIESAGAQSLQLYQIPLSYTVREPAGRSLGVKLTFPVTLGTHELTAATSVGDLAARVESATITPGLELVFRAGERWTIKPFGEVELGTATDGLSGAVFAGGVRALGRRDYGPVSFTLGTAVRYASPRSRRDLIQDYTTIELGLDGQTPLGVALGKHRLRGGGYAIVRYFPDLELPEGVLFDIGRTYEVGLSFAGSPELAILGLKLPWIGLGYRFGDLFTGYRISFSFPF